jgi:hypothetical protein
MAPTSLMGVAKTLCQTSLFFTKTLAISCIQPTIVFRFKATLCEDGSSRA